MMKRAGRLIIITGLTDHVAGLTDHVHRITQDTETWKNQCFVINNKLRKVAHGRGADIRPHTYIFQLSARTRHPHNHKPTTATFRAAPPRFCNNSCAASAFGNVRSNSKRSQPETCRYLKLLFNNCNREDQLAFGCDSNLPLLITKINFFCIYCLSIYMILIGNYSQFLANAKLAPITPGTSLHVIKVQEIILIFGASAE